jgi:flagellar basal-body rod modification protein FlgD
MAVQSISDASSAVFLEDFLKLLLTQLTQQNPLKPMEHEQFLAQMAQFTTLQQTQVLNQQISQVLVTDMSSQAVALMGKTVGFSTGTQVVSGKVSGVSFKDGQPLLQLTVDGRAVDGVTLSSVVSIQ